MKKIFLDTNIVMDYYIRPEFSPLVAELLKDGAGAGYEFVVSFLTVANVAYILRKIPVEKRFDVLSQILKSFEIASNTFDHLHHAMDLDAKDFEDAIQYETAVSTGCDAIITRNGNDFSFSELPIYTPQEFLTILKSY